MKREIINYDYYFYFGDEYLKADNCYSGSYGRTYCELNGRTYSNVSYEKVESSREIKEVDVLAGIVGFIILIILIVVWLR